MKLNHTDRNEETNHTLLNTRDEINKEGRNTNYS